MPVQRRTLYAKCLAGVIILAASLVIPAAPRNVPRPFMTTVWHPHIRALRNDDGTLKRGIRNEIESSNWSGYAVANFSTGALYTAAQASWNVPQVSYVAPPPVCHVIYIFGAPREICSSARAEAEYSSSWVGIGGYCENANCTAVDSTLVQLGTEQDVSRSGTTEYYAWVEVLPNNPILIAKNYPSCASPSCAYPVHPGDAITASLSCQSDCSPGQTQSWLLTMTDATANWTFSTTINYASTLMSAEWIQEAPSSRAGVLPLADFVPTTFDATINSDSSPDIPPGPSGAPGPDAILMIDPYGETSAPSPIEASPYLDAFATCWGNNPSDIASCPAP